MSRGYILAMGLCGALVGAWLFLPGPGGTYLWESWAWLFWSLGQPQVAAHLPSDASSFLTLPLLTTFLAISVPRNAFLVWRFLRVRRANKTPMHGAPSPIPSAEVEPTGLPAPAVTP